MCCPQRDAGSLSVRRHAMPCSNARGLWCALQVDRFRQGPVPVQGLEREDLVSLWGWVATWCCSRILFHLNLEGYVTKCAPNKVLKSIEYGKLTFDEGVVLHRMAEGFGFWDQGFGFRG